MKIVKIKIIADKAFVVDGDKYPAVELTIKKLFSNKTIKVFPSSKVIDKHTNFLKYAVYSDELGKELKDEESMQINAFLVQQRLLGLL